MVPRLKGRKEVEAISNSLGQAVVGFMTRCTLHDTSSKCGVVSATLLELRRSIQGPLDLYDPVSSLDIRVVEADVEKVHSCNDRTFHQAVQQSF